MIFTFLFLWAIGSLLSSFFVWAVCLATGIKVKKEAMIFIVVVVGLVFAVIISNKI